MSRKYKFLNKEGLYFVSFATVYWIDVFTRPVYNDIIVDSLTYCKNNIGYCTQSNVVIKENLLELIVAFRRDASRLYVLSFRTRYEEKSIH